MIMRATQKKMMSKPVTRTEEGRYVSSSLVLSGQPSEENGTSCDENQVSKTSGSLVNLLLILNFSTTSSSVLPTNTFPCSSYQAGIWWPHQSWREMHQSWMFSSQWL